MSALGRHYKTRELSELLSVSPQTLRAAALRGELCPVRVGSDLIWPEQEVVEWLDRNRVDNSRVVSLHTRASTNRRSR